MRIELRSRKQALQSVLDSIQNPARQDSTGLSKLDLAMGGGLYAGKAYGLQARKKIGKTVLLGTISYNLNMAGVNHLWVAAEMNDRELEQRHIARALNKNAIDFMDPNGLETEEIVTEYQATAPNHIIYANAAGIRFDELSEVVDVAVKKHGINGFILDYLQLVRATKGGGSRVDHLDAVAQWVSAVVRKHQIWALVAAQLNQEDNTRGGEGMLLAFDQVYTLHREKFSSEAWLEMMESRYTTYRHVGSWKRPGLKLEQTGPYFSQTE
jgi:replicative DNA helicase